MRRIVCLLHLLATTWTYPLYNLFEPVYPLSYPYSGYSGLNYGYNYVPESATFSHYIPSNIEKLIQDDAITKHSTVPEVASTLNVLAEIPYTMSKEFTVVPMFVVSKNAMKMVPQGHIVSASDQQPEITVKLNTDTFIPCTPAVRMVLEQPIIVGSLRSEILFPSEVQIIHEGVRIPITIGAVIAPVLPNTYVSNETPVAVRVIYAVPTKPIRIKITIEQVNDESENKQPGAPQSSVTIDERLPEISSPSTDEPFSDNTLPQNQPQELPNPGNQPEVISNIPLVGLSENSQVGEEIVSQSATDQILPSPGASSEPPINAGFGALAINPDYINNADGIFIPNQESVIVESESELPPKNITVINFPEKEAEPQLQVDEEDEELVNRNPPVFLAPAGIIQSTQPETHVETFHNDKESPYLETLREQSNRKRI